MKTTRFSSVVEAAGRPATHLVLVSPEQDQALQAAVKSHRLMTVHRRSTGNRADYGTVGFELGGGCQYLVFPKSLSRFRESRIVGITYDLLEDRAKEVAKSPQPRPAAARQRTRSRKETVRPKRTSEKVIHFATPPSAKELDEESGAVREIKAQVRRAMEILEQGKQVAAFNLLKRIVNR